MSKLNMGLNNFRVICDQEKKLCFEFFILPLFFKFVHFIIFKRSFVYFPILPTNFVLKNFPFARLPHYLHPHLRSRAYKITTKVPSSNSLFRKNGGASIHCGAHWSYEWGRRVKKRLNCFFTFEEK